MVDIYHSFNPINLEKFDSLHRLHELSALAALRSYGSIHLITTVRGSQLLSDIPYTSVEFFDDYIPEFEINTTDILEKYKNVWALSKIFAYKQISKKRRPFLHIDYDVFLFKRLPHNFEIADVVLQSLENEYLTTNYYELDVYENSCPIKNIHDSNIKYAYNCGVIGGTNYHFFDTYFKECLELILHPSNQNYFLNYEQLLIEKYEPHGQKAGNSHLISCVVEQYLIAQLLKAFNINPLLILDLLHYSDWYDFCLKTNQKCNELGFTHLFGGNKWDALTQERIKNKISELKKLQ